MTNSLVALRAVWSQKFVNDLPDDSFAYVEPGDKDDTGRTVPRSKRHLPYRDSSGKADPSHTRNALARLPQTDIPDAAKAKARRKLVAAARELGIEVSDDAGRSAQPTAARGAPIASYEGSYEDLQDALRSALNPAGPWSQGYWSIRETHPDYLICTHWSEDPDASPTSWRVAYRLDDEGQPVLGARQPASAGAPDVRAGGVIAPGVAPFVTESSYLHRQILAWHESTKALIARRAAEERPPSPANCRALTEVRDALLAVASSLQDILVDAEERRAAHARAAYLCQPHVRKRELELAQWLLASLPADPSVSASSP